MTTVYVDFDNTIVESNQKVIEILNDKYGLNKSEDDLEDYGYVRLSSVDASDKLRNGRPKNAVYSVNPRIYD